MELRRTTTTSFSHRRGLWLSVLLGKLMSKLRFSLKNNCRIIDACMRLHNFIVEYRESAAAADDTDERYIFEDDFRRFLAASPVFLQGGIHGGEDEAVRDANFEPTRGGRPTRAESESEKLGREWRDSICNNIAAQHLIRPLSNWYRNQNRMHQD